MLIVASSTHAPPASATALPPPLILDGNRSDPGGRSAMDHSVRAQRSRAEDTHRSSAIGQRSSRSYAQPPIPTASAPRASFPVFAFHHFLTRPETSLQVEGQPWVPVGSTVGPLLVGRHPWVSAQKSSTVGSRDQFSVLRAQGNQTKLSTFDTVTVAFRVRRRPDRFHASRGASPLHSPCQKFGNTDYFFKLPAKVTMRGSMKLWETA